MIADLNCGGKVRRHIPIVEKVRTAGPGLWAIFLDSRRKIPLATLDRQLRAATSEGGSIAGPKIPLLAKDTGSGTLRFHGYVRSVRPGRPRLRRRHYGHSQIGLEVGGYAVAGVGSENNHRARRGDT